MNTFLRLLKQRSVQVFLAVAIYLGIAPWLPMEIHQGFYTISLLIKDLLLWILPCTVGVFIAYAISSFEKRALFFVLSLFMFEAVSNACSVWYAFGCAHLTTHYLHAIVPYQVVDAFSPLWRLPFIKPLWWSAQKGTLVGIALGLSSAFFFPFLRQGVARAKKIAEQILTQFFARLIPLFILGFIAKMYQTKLLQQVVAHSLDLLLWLVLYLSAYIALLFFIGSGFSLKVTLKSIKNLLPAAGVAFSSGCSLSTMPWTIEGSAKNLQNPELAKAIIPATTNIQQIGDCIINIFLSCLIYSHFNGHLPPLSSWIPFSLVFVGARFATAAVLGGAIFIMLPIYEGYLGFTPEMIAVILAFNVLLDPLVTSSNVIANGALCRIFEGVWSKQAKKVAYK